MCVFVGICMYLVPHSGYMAVNPLIHPFNLVECNNNHFIPY